MEKRFWELDFLRATAVIMMVVFHFLWDLNYFGFAQFDLYSGFLGGFQKTTAGLFLLLAGVGLSLSCNRSPKDYPARFLKKSLKIFFFAFLLTGFSLAFFSTQPIFFGILHLIAFSVILSVPFARQKNACLLLGIFFILFPVFFDLQPLGIKPLFFVGLSKPFPALDFFPVFPWFGVVLLGIFAGHSFYENGKPKIALKEPQNMLADALQVIGRNSLFVYFIHQPILAGLLFLASMIF